MKFKGLFALAVSLTLIVGLSACKNNDKSKESKENMIISVIVKADFIGDEALTDEVVSSLEDIQEDEDISIRFLEVADDNNYEVVMEEAINEGAKLILLTDGEKKAVDAMMNVSSKNKNIKFALFDSDIDKENVKRAVFENNQSAFLAGYVASSSSKTKNIGFLSIKNDKKAEEYRAGYFAGAKYADKNIKIFEAELEEQPSISDGYDVAKSLIEKNKIDVIYHKVGIAGKGVIEASEDEEIYAIGSEKDQSYLSSKYVLASTVKNVKLPLKNMIKEALSGKFKNDSTIYNLTNDGVDLKDRAGNMSTSLVNEVNKLKEEIKNGKIICPKNKEELKKFEEKL